MERWKDMFYNKNDIFLALVILLVAGFVIYDRVDAIMEYPQALALEQEQNATSPAEQDPSAETATTPEAKPVEEPVQEGTPNQTQQPAAQPQQPATSQKPAQTPVQQATKVQIDIPSGTTEATVGKMLVEKGFISDKSSFIQALEAAGKTGKVQAGKFTIPSDATMEQIIDLLTN